MKAIKILWTIPFSERDYAGTNGGIKGGRDWNVSSSSFNFPSSNPSFDPTLENPLEEMLIMTDVALQSVPDLRVYRSESYVTPTNVKNSTFVKVNEYQNQTRYVFKSLTELVAAINQRETEANIKVRLESNFDKVSMVSQPIVSKYATVTLTEIEQKIYDRVMEVQARAIANDENARRLMTIAEFNDSHPVEEHQVFDINSGWQEDGITPLDIPFNELFNA
jgi:hypothetical protein